MKPKHFGGSDKLRPEIPTAAHICVKESNDVCLFFFPLRFGQVHPSSSLVTLVRTYRHTATRQSPPSNEKLKRR
jgi:hypothetical protein